VVAKIFILSDLISYARATALGMTPRMSGALIRQVPQHLAVFCVLIE
jgi:hypothetical protein